MSAEMTSVHVGRILVVDDTSANLQLLTNLLTGQGYGVHPASDGELALRFVQSILPDLILLDIKMPGMDGFEVCRRLKADQRTASIPIIFISILEDEGDKVKGFQAGAVDYITKPLQPEEVLARVETHLRLRALTVRLEQEVRERTEALGKTNQRLQQELAERKKAEMQILASERRFRALVENSPDFIARYDLGFRRIYVNPAIQKLFGEAAEDVLNKKPADESPVHAPQTYIDQLRQVVESASERAIEMPFRTAQGEMHWGHMRFVPEFGPDGEVASVLAIGRDVHEIKESERRFRMLAENFPDAVVRFDRDGRYTYVNPAVEKAFGLPAEAFIGKRLPELRPNSDQEQIDTATALIRRTFDEGVANDGEMSWDTPRGKRYYKTRNVPEKDATGNVVSVLGIAHDITEIRQAADELRASEARFRTFVDHAADAFFLHDEGGAILDVNRQACESLGYTREELVGMTPYHFDASLDPAVIDEMEARLAAKEVIVFDTRHRRKDGRVFPVEVRSRGFRQGERQLAVSFARDITERKQMEAALAAQEREFRTLAENSPDNISRYDTHCRVVYVNPTQVKTLGRPASEILGSTPMEQSGNDDGRKYQEKISAVLQTGANAEMDVVVPDRGAGVRYHNVRFVPERGSDGAITGVLAMGRDVTERVQAEVEIRLLNQELEQRVADRTAKLEQANKELGAFAYSVSHDLRAPLRHIDGFIGLLHKKAAGALDEQGRHYMDAIAGAAQKMGLLIDDLLAFSRMGRHAMAFRPVALGTLVHAVIQELEPDAAGRHIDWRIGDLPVVSGDAAMLQMVLSNLIANALKFTRPRHRAEIEIGCQGGEKETIFFIRDNGVGFDMTYVDKLFGVFQRLHRAEEFEGTGIGLATVQRIIQRHGGTVWAESEVEKGTAIYFTIP
jgi:PAS domain S-box-containing protein